MERLLLGLACFGFIGLFIVAGALFGEDTDKKEDVPEDFVPCADKNE